MAFDARVSVDRGLTHLARRLDPIIDARLRPSLGGLPWPTVLSELDKMRGKSPKTYAASDLQAQLKAITERLGSLGFPFDDHTRLVTSLGNELRIVRNRWAHNDELTTLDSWRTHDLAVRLLERFGDAEGVSGATELREEAFHALVEEKGIAAHVTPPISETVAAPMQAAKAGVADPDVVRPDPAVLQRADARGTPTLGAGRDEFVPWTIVLVGDVSVLDDLPKKVSKEKVRAVAREIVEFEGPIHLDRLAQLTAASFGVQRLWPAREKKLIYQIRQLGLVVDTDKFVWPADLDPATWREFRPNDSNVDRPFTEISPVEIANAMRFLKDQQPGIDDSALDTVALQTFGRRRKTRQFAIHLAKASAIASTGATR
jgi:hypothetical protein